MPSVKCLMASSWLPAAKAALPLACSACNRVVGCLKIYRYVTVIDTCQSRTLNASDAIAG